MSDRLLLLLLCALPKPERTAANVPVSQLGAQYVKDTRALTDAIETYITIVSRNTLLGWSWGLAGMASRSWQRQCGRWLWLEVLLHSKQLAYTQPWSAPPPGVTSFRSVLQSCGTGRLVLLPHQLTTVLSAGLDSCVCQDVYDKKRQGLIKQLKQDALGWVSKYARGGSVRAQSARQM